MDATPLHRRLLHILTEERECAERLALLLSESRQLFAGSDGERIHEAASRIQALVTEVEGHEQRRQGLLSEAGFTTDQKGTEDFFTAHDPEGLARPEWERLLESAAEVRKQNQVNATIVEGSRRRAEKAFSLLRGENPRQQTYGSHGKTRLGGGSRSLGEA